MQKMQGAVVGKSERVIHKQIGGLGHQYRGQGCGYPNFSVQLIHQEMEGDKEALAKKMVYWQNQLRCYLQNGGCAHCRRKEKIISRGVVATPRPIQTKRKHQQLHYQYEKITSMCKYVFILVYHIL